MIVHSRILLTCTIITQAAMTAGVFQVDCRLGKSKAHCGSESRPGDEHLKQSAFSDNAFLAPVSRFPYSL